MKLRRIASLACASLIIILTSCTNTPTVNSTPPISSSITNSSTSPIGSSGNSSSKHVAVSSISISIDNNTLAVGETANLTIDVLPRTATNRSYEVINSNDEVLSVSGLTVTALKTGEATIKVVANDGGKEDSVQISVKDSIPKLGEIAMLNKLSETIYTDNFRPQDNSILSETEKIGIDKETFINQSLYPVPDNAVVYNASDYDIMGENILNSSLLNNLINEIGSQDGVKVIKFDNATYRFNSTITGTDVRDLYLVGEPNTKFIYNGWVTYIKFINSSDIHINSITFDMDPSPSVVGTIKEVIDETTSSATVVLDIPSEFDLSHQLYSKWGVLLQGSYSEYVYDETYDTLVPDLSGNLYYSNGKNSSVKGITAMSYDSSARVLKVTLSKNFGPCSYRTPKIGNKAAIGFTVYDYHGFHFQNCTDTYVEDLTCYVTAGMGMRFDEGENAYLNRVKFIRDENRLLTCTADILHTAHLSGDFVITNSVLEGSHDDAINVKTFYTKVNSIQANVMNVIQTQSEVVIDFEVGDTIEVYNPDGFAYSNSFTVQEVKRYGNNFELTLDRSIPRSYTNYLVGNTTKATHMTLENSLISNKRNRGILLQGKESVIRNCAFQNVLMGGIQVLAVADSFNEAIVPTDITIENTKFLNCVDTLRIFCYDSKGQSTVGTIHDVIVRNNYFSMSKGQEIFIQGTKDVSVTNNLILSSSKAHSIRAITSSDLEISNNNAYFVNAITNYSFLITAEVTNLTAFNNKHKEIKL